MCVCLCVCVCVCVNEQATTLFCRCHSKQVNQLSCSALQCVAVCCSVLQCVAVCCRVLPCVAVCCRPTQTPQYKHSLVLLLCCTRACAGALTRPFSVVLCFFFSPLSILSSRTNHDRLQHITTHCITLQCTATHYITMQHTATNTLSSRTSQFCFIHARA